jgi:integrase
VSSIERRTNSDGSISVRVKFIHDGKRKTRTFIDDAHAQSWRSVLDAVGPDRALTMLEQPATPGPAPRTVAEQVRHHIEHLSGVQEGTRAKYRKVAAARLSGELERTLLSDLTRDHVSRWVNAQTGSPKTIRNAHSILSAALSSAARDGLVTGNVAKGVKLPRMDHVDQTDNIYLTTEEAGILLGLLPGPWRPLVAFLLGTGVRFSEATALTVGHIDVDNRSAHIRQSWKSAGPGKPHVLGVPKTRKSRRTIALPVEIVAMLEVHMKGKRSTDWLFTNSRGNPVRNGPFHENVWQPIMDEFQQRTGKRPRPHDCRHTFASWAIRSGIPLPVIQRQLGHESIQTTVDVYGALVRSDLDLLAVTIGRDLPPLISG